MLSPCLCLAVLPGVLRAHPRRMEEEGAQIPHAALCLWESLLRWCSDPGSKHTLHRAANGNQMAERGLLPSAVTLLSCAGNPSAVGGAIHQHPAALGDRWEQAGPARAAPLGRGRGERLPAPTLPERDTMLRRPVTIEGSGEWPWGQPRGSPLPTSAPGSGRRVRGDGRGCWATAL